MLYNKLKIINLFLLLICNYSYSQSNKNNKDFPKYTSSEKRLIGYEKRLEIESSSIVKNILFRNINTYGDLSETYKNDVDYKVLNTALLNLKYPLIKNTKSFY